MSPKWVPVLIEINRNQPNGDYSAIMRAVCGSKADRALHDHGQGPTVGWHYPVSDQKLDARTAGACNRIEIGAEPERFGLKAWACYTKQKAPVAS
jgi:hypothetical protein